LSIKKVENAGNERKKLLLLISLAIREFASETSPTDRVFDIVSFIALALREVSRSVGISVSAWEKRGYWVKADRYQMEWQWTGILSQRLQDALLAGNWDLVVTTTTDVARRLGDITSSQRKLVEQPWTGSWKVLKELHKE
jgi:hypothetical protein